MVVEGVVKAVWDRSWAQMKIPCGEEVVGVDYPFVINDNSVSVGDYCRCYEEIQTSACFHSCFYRGYQRRVGHWRVSLVATSDEDGI